MIKPFASYLTSHDDQRDAVIKWTQDCQPAPTRA